MNYRHAYHAGNFADVLKHVALALVIEHLKKKPAAFRIIDTHAGTGVYELASDQAQKTGEWRQGIGRVIGATSIPVAVADVLGPYLGAVEAENPSGAITRYPGSPALARRLMRADDRLVVNELHPEDCADLRRAMAGDARVKVLELDAWVAIKSLLPPKERRGVVLVDPPFEEAGELERMADGLAAATRRFATGTFILWYPIKDPKPVARFHERAATTGIAKLLLAEQTIRHPGDATRLNGSGLLIVNPPFTLAAQLEIALTWLTPLLAQAPGAGWRVTSLTPERA